MPKNLIKKVQNTVFQRGLFARGEKIVVGVSGGPDSVCLLDVLAKIATKSGMRLIIAHVNYGLRGEDSKKDEYFVRKLAEKYGIRSSVFEAKSKGKISENVLRETRYEFFEKVRKKNKFGLIAVAHNTDDQVETFLMRIIRGAGLQGLSAMKYKNGKIIRPLLDVSRKEILEYLKKNDLKFREDKTNLQNLFFRNKVRNELIPYLEKNFNPNIRRTIFRSIDNIAEDYSLIAGLAEQELKTMKQLSVKKILNLHPALQREILRNFLGKEDIRDIEASHINEIIKAISSIKGKNQTLVLNGLKIVRKGDKLTIEVLKH